MTTDAYQHDFRDTTVVNVVMSRYHALAYQTWLRQRGLHLRPAERGEGEPNNIEPVYCLGIDDHLVNQWTPSSVVPPVWTQHLRRD